MFRHISVAVALSTAVWAGGFLTPGATSVNELDRAFTQGKHGGDLAALGQFSSEDDSFIYGYANLYFTTANYLGFRGDVGFSGVGVWWKDDDAYFTKDTSSMHTANLGFFSNQFSVAAGRGGLDLVLASLFYQGAIAEFKPSNKLSLQAAYITSMAGTNYGMWERFFDYQKINDDGALVLNVSFKDDSLNVNPYLFFIPDIGTWLGGKITIDQLKRDGGFTVTAQGFLTFEDDDTNEDDGLFIELQGDFNIQPEIGIFGGFAFAGSDGTGSAGKLGKEWHKTGAQNAANKINPFWDGGCQIFLPEALTFYGGAEFARDKLWAGAMLGITTGG
ncbi:MAG: hypothetical protein LBE89_08595, partial [Helicobacteraceae bacterium]|nr:hypothetical protein [Helicobacteraceae bacterium]